MKEQNQKSNKSGNGDLLIAAALFVLLVVISVVFYRTDKLSASKLQRVIVLVFSWALAIARNVYRIKKWSDEKKQEEKLSFAEVTAPAEPSADVFIPDEVAKLHAEEAANAAAAESAEGADVAAEVTEVAEAVEAEVTEEKAETAVESVEAENVVQETAEVTEPEAPATAENSEAEAYWTKSGKTYHTCRSCSALARSKNVMQGTIQDAVNAGKKSVCGTCAATCG
jgi:hypothetical protein